MQHPDGLEWCSRMIRSLREPLLLASREGRILAANATGAEALGTTIASLIGSSLAGWSPSRENIDVGLRAAISGAPLTLRAPDDRRCFCDVIELGPDLLQLRLSGGPDAEARARALLGLVAASPATAEAAQTPSRLERLQAFTSALARAITIAEVIETALDMAMAATAALSGGIWRTSPDERSAHLVRSVGPTGPRAGDHTLVPIEPRGRMPILDAIGGGTPVWLESCRDIERDYPATYAAFSRGGEASLACLPLLAQGRSIGGLVLVFAGARVFDEDERSFLRLFAWYSAQALERARLHAAEKAGREESEASRRRSDILADAGARFASSLDARSTLASAAEVAVPRAADWCIAKLEDGQATSVAHVDASKIARLSSLAAHVDLEDSAFASLASDVGNAARIVVPIEARGRTLGTIVLGRAEPGRAFDESDRAMAEDLGRRVGLSIDNALLYREAREADRLKDEFLAMLGHELRNPLAPIVTAIEVLDSRGEQAFPRERELIGRHVRHVVRLVDDLLDVSRVTRGKLQLVRSRWETAVVIADAVEMTSALVAEKRHRLSVRAASQGLPIVADRVRIAQALANLLTNAAKYTAAGGDISLEADVEGSEVVVRVRDSGVGIPKESLSRIFDLFVQESASLDRARGGMGIGLTIVKRLVELHGGSVSAHSEGLGHGAEITLRLPLATSDATSATSAPPHAVSPSDAHALRVLVVDDSEDAAEMLSLVLEGAGCTTRTAGDGPSALAAAADFAPHVGLLDIGLPEMDGYELARRLRSTSIGAAMHLVALTGYGQDSDRQRAIEAGFDEHLVKPVRFESVRAVLDRARATLALS